ncbi:MAG: xylan 1,4-beta-xylosidase [Enterobacterales bacterium]|jgi:xylan 1,4-beta-xylosidase
MKKIINPILKGFNPDPSIVRVDDDFYIVTSTFEWFPGCQIHHSKDLINWQLINRPLNKLSQLDMKGVPDSCGVWAPCLTYNNGLFYLVYSNVKSFNGVWKDTPNYVVTATNINGPWSNPTFINASGFDASLFHDDDGKSYFVNMLIDHRNGKLFGGVVLQEFDAIEKKLLGKIHYIFTGTNHGCTEAPHLYKRNGYYYLMTAEGGTGYGHCITLARSTSIFGPYKVHPENPIITAKYSPENYLQKQGHGDLVEMQNCEWYLVFLTGRPLTKLGRCITGRETAIEKVEWRDDNWLYLACGGNVARKEVEAPLLSEHSFLETKQRITFITSTLDINFQSLRVPMSDDWVSLEQRTGYLRLYGRESLSSCFEQSMIARRVQAHHTIAYTCLEFSPENFQQMAGLVCYYNTIHYHYLHISGDDFGAYSGRKFINISSCDNHTTTSPLDQPIEISNSTKIYLKADFNGKNLQFYFATQAIQDKPIWKKIGPELDGSILSDDYVAHEKNYFNPCFTGAFYGLACQDLSGSNSLKKGLHADFSFFDYQELD